MLRQAEARHAAETQLLRASNRKAAELLKEHTGGFAAGFAGVEHAAAAGDAQKQVQAHVQQAALDILAAPAAGSRAAAATCPQPAGRRNCRSRTRRSRRLSQH